MINKNQQLRESKNFRKGLFHHMVAAMAMSFFNSGREEPFTIKAARLSPDAEKPAVSFNSFGYTYKRVKKVGNFFAYGWVKHDKREVKS